MTTIVLYIYIFFNAIYLIFIDLMFVWRCHLQTSHCLMYLDIYLDIGLFYRFY